MFFFIKHQQTREKELEHPCGSVGIRSCSVLESTVVFPFFSVITLQWNTLFPLEKEISEPKHVLLFFFS